MNSTRETAVPAASRPRLVTGAVAALAVAALAAVAGCQSTAAAAGSPAPAAPTQAAASSAPAPTHPSTPAAPVTSSAAPSAPSAPAGTPVLGQLSGLFAHGSGFGQARPAEIFNGGDPTGLVNKITWQSWGGATATGTGTSTYVAGNQPVASGTPQSATVVAFNLGTCDGKLMYQAVEWYFPQHGQSFSSTHYENVCAGSYVPAA